MKPFEYYIAMYEEHLKAMQLSESTITLKRFLLRPCIKYLITCGRDIPHEVEEEDLAAFVRHIKGTVSRKTGRPYSSATIHRMICALREFFSFLVRKDMLLSTPFESFEYSPRVESKKREVFSKDEMNAFLDSIDTKAEHGLLIRAAFELMYSSGLRSGELLTLRLQDVDFEDRTLLVRQGKGNKDRYVPFSEVALYFLRRYITHERKSSERKALPEYRELLFLTRHGRISTGRLRKWFREILKSIDLHTRRFTLHSVRYATATHLLEAGADIRYVQELLGHEDIRTTVQYTSLQLDSIRRVYKMYHPRENEFYTEVDEDYLKAVENLRQELRDKTVGRSGKNKVL